ncbi:hypothetical protein BRD56_09480 [Thermoplasmatales archaeon SW_10_69_26]|jgi:hypothetical protein|nr:MAG: hypothetical protein BRD56_09480 [Thermoplasmatales archaeon SW_10_69_26]
MARPTTAMKSASWTNLVLGAIVFATPFFTGATGAALWSAVIAGGLIALLAAFDVYEESADAAERVRGPSMVNVVAGAWLLVGAFVLGASMAYAWVTGLAGAIVVATSWYNASKAGDLRTV